MKEILERKKRKKKKRKIYQRMAWVSVREVKNEGVLCQRRIGFKILRYKVYKNSENKLFACRFHKLKILTTR